MRVDQQPSSVAAEGALDIVLAHAVEVVGHGNSAGQEAESARSRFFAPPSTRFDQ
jgi:hypothetical protein